MRRAGGCGTPLASELPPSPAAGCCRADPFAPEWVSAGILFNAVAPAVAVTPMTRAVLADPAARAELDRTLPMPIGRYARPEEVAERLLWLASPANSLVVGQVLFADGGAEALGRGERTW